MLRRFPMTIFGAFVLSTLVVLIFEMRSDLLLGYGLSRAALTLVLALPLAFAVEFRLQDENNGGDCRVSQQWRLAPLICGMVYFPFSGFLLSDLLRFALLLVSALLLAFLQWAGVDSMPEIFRVRVSRFLAALCWAVGAGVALNIILFAIHLSSITLYLGFYLHATVTLPVFLIKLGSEGFLSSRIDRLTAFLAFPFYACAFRRLIFLSMLPFSLAIIIYNVQAIIAHGFSELRVLALLFALLLSLFSVVFGFLDKGRIQLIPYSLMVTGIVSVVSPINIFTISMTSQQLRLQKLFEKNDMLVDGHMRDAVAPLSRDDYLQLHKTVDYLLRYYGYSAIRPFVPVAWGMREKEPWLGSSASEMTDELVARIARPEPVSGSQRK